MCKLLESHNLQFHPRFDIIVPSFCSNVCNVWVVDGELASMILHILHGKNSWVYLSHPAFACLTFDIGHWTLDIGHWTLDIGRWTSSRLDSDWPSDMKYQLALSAYRDVESIILIMTIIH